MVLFLATIIVSLALSMGAVSYNEISNSSSASKSATALSYALSGAHDTLEHIAKNKNYFVDNLATVHNAPALCYTINFTAGTFVSESCTSTGSTNCPSGTASECASIRVDTRVDTVNSLTLPLSPGIITVTGQSGTYIRKIQVDSVFDYINTLYTGTFVEIKNLATASTAQATAVTANAADLHGWTNPNSSGQVYAWFRYTSTAPTTGCADTDTFGTRAPPDTSVISTDTSSPAVNLTGTTPQNFLQHISGLTTATTYYYCTIVGNSDGTTVQTYGNIFAFTTN